MQVGVLGFSNADGPFIAGYRYAKSELRKDPRALQITNRVIMEDVSYKLPSSLGT